MQRTESESWPPKKDIVQRALRFSKPVVKDGMKLKRTTRQQSESLLSTSSTSEITEENGVKTTGNGKKKLEKLLCQE